MAVGGDCEDCCCFPLDISSTPWGIIFRFVLLRGEHISMESGCCFRSGYFGCASNVREGILEPELQRSVVLVAILVATVIFVSDQ
jgi:hypothetical protein